MPRGISGHAACSMRRSIIGQLQRGLSSSLPYLQHSSVPHGQGQSGQHGQRRNKGITFLSLLTTGQEDPYLPRSHL